MTVAPVIRTARLTLRPHRLSDWEPIAVFFESDAARYVGGPLPRRRSWFGFGADVGSWELLGFGPWAVDETATGAFVGQIGLNQPAHFPEHEIGWIVFPAFQGRGFATEGARAARDFAADTLGWTTAVSYIDPANAASIAVARHLGCTEDPDAARFDADDLVFRHPMRAASAGASIDRSTSPEGPL
jgi:RimJ/RimL family protein N-acetyltransferase